MPGAGDVLWRPCRRLEAALDRLGRRHHGPRFADVRAAAPAGRCVPCDDRDGQQCVRVGVGGGGDCDCDIGRKRNVGGGPECELVAVLTNIFAKPNWMQHNLVNMRKRVKWQITAETSILATYLNA